MAHEKQWALVVVSEWTVLLFPGGLWMVAVISCVDSKRSNADIDVYFSTSATSMGN